MHMCVRARASVLVRARICVRACVKPCRVPQRRELLVDLSLCLSLSHVSPHRTLAIVAALASVAARHEAPVAHSLCRSPPPSVFLRRASVVAAALACVAVLHVRVAAAVAEQLRMRTQTVILFFPFAAVE